MNEPLPLAVPWHTHTQIPLGSHPLRQLLHVDKSACNGTRVSALSVFLWLSLMVGLERTSYVSRQLTHEFVAF
jgi:hypothetical protein